MPLVPFLGEIKLHQRVEPQLSIPAGEAISVAIFCSGKSIFDTWEFAVKIVQRPFSRLACFEV